MAHVRLLCEATGREFDVSLPLPYGVQRQVDDGGLAVVAEIDAEQPGTRPAGMPRGNASHEAWINYALTQGMSHADASALTRDELRDRFRDTGFRPQEVPVRDITPLRAVV